MASKHWIFRKCLFPSLDELLILIIWLTRFFHPKNRKCPAKICEAEQVFKSPASFIYTLSFFLSYLTGKWKNLFVFISHDSSNQSSKLSNFHSQTHAYLNPKMRKNKLNFHVKRIFSWPTFSQKLKKYKLQFISISLLNDFCSNNLNKFSPIHNFSKIKIYFYRPKKMLIGAIFANLPRKKLNCSPPYFECKFIRSNLEIYE